MRSPRDVQADPPIWLVLIFCSIWALAVANVANQMYKGRNMQPDPPAMHFPHIETPDMHSEGRTP